MERFAESYYDILFKDELPESPIIIPASIYIETITTPKSMGFENELLEKNKRESNNKKVGLNCILQCLVLSPRLVLLKNA